MSTTKSLRLAIAATVFTGLALSAPTASAQTPAPGTDIAGKPVFLRPLSLLRFNESLLAKPYTLTRVTLEVIGRGRCNDGWCPLTHNNVALFARRTHLDLGRPQSGIVVSERTLRRGDTGEDVKAIQEILNKKGARLVADGVYGRGTIAAVVDFQRRSGLLADGEVGRATRKALAG